MENDIARAMQKAQEGRRKAVLSSFTNVSEVTDTDNSITKAETGEVIEKAEESEINPFEVDETLEKGEEVDEELEKSDIFNALDYSNNIKVKKTGKEIKDNINTILLPEVNAELAVKKVEATTLLGDCGTAPAMDVPEWWTRDLRIDCGFKRYDWDETYIPENDNRIAPTLSYENSKEVASKAKNVPETKEQAEARRKYNDKVREVCECLTDVKACEIINMIGDDEKVELTPRQLMTFRF